MNLATMVALSAQESKLADVGTVANCVGSGQNGKMWTTIRRFLRARTTAAARSMTGRREDRNSKIWRTGKKNLSA